MEPLEGMDVKPHYRRTWSRPISTLPRGFARNPKLAWQLVRDGMKLLDTKSLRQFSLAIHGRDFLADIYAVADDVGIRPYLMWGTLLGAVREGRLMPHDTDIDLGLSAADYTRKAAFVSGMLRRGYFFTFDETHKFRLLRRDHVLHADFDVFYPADNRMICLCADSEGHYGASFPGNSFEQLREIEILDGLRVLIPDPPEAILQTIYGPDWRTPSPGYNSGNDLANRLRIPKGQPIPPLP
jgi:phosphorylcholine metabolism protein LicD